MANRGPESEEIMCMGGNQREKISRLGERHKVTIQLKQKKKKKKKEKKKKKNQPKPNLRNSGQEAKQKRRQKK